MAGVLTLADFKTVADSIAKQASDLAAAFTSVGWANNRATILAEADLIAAAPLALAFGSDPSPNLPSAYASRLTALRAALGDLNAYLIANDSRIHANFNTILNAGIAARSIFPPVYSGGTKLGDFVAIDATTGTFTAGVNVDTTKYGKAWLTLHMTHDITDALMVTVTGKKLDGTSHSVGPIDLTGKMNADQANVGTLGLDADHFVQVTAIVITGGTAADAFDIETRLERTIAA
ncbi:MAG: hypothetical protein ACRDQZ_25455 [Mycobacteriales bacterium]